MLREFGDFQTPEPLVELILACLTKMNSNWHRVLEPTCGTGNFIRGVLYSSNISSVTEVYGIEVQPAHWDVAKGIQQNNSSRIKINLLNANIFDLHLRTDLNWQTKGNLLVIGNPPWVTSSELGSLNSNNMPQKYNLKGLSGIDALTGGSNFDIAEYIWLKLIWELREENPTIALLCKTSVARNVLQYANKSKLPISHSYIRKIDSKKWFDADVDACLFVVELGTNSDISSVDVYSDLISNIPEQTIGIRDGNLIASINEYEETVKIDGVFPFDWRQGVKHDAVNIMQLTCLENGEMRNKLGNKVVVENDYVYPFLKSSDLYNMRIKSAKRGVIITQHYIGQETASIENMAPNLWTYLQEHKHIFDQRKSSIYVGKPDFSIFGIGEYSFSEYKVAISGMYKIPKFVAIGPLNGRPVMFDDTCYFVRCTSAIQAGLITALLNTPVCQKFLLATTFADAKRPITKRLLQRIDLYALLDIVDTSQVIEEAKQTASQISASTIINQELDADKLKNLLQENGSKPF